LTSCDSPTTIEAPWAVARASACPMSSVAASTTSLLARYIRHPPRSALTSEPANLLRVHLHPLPERACSFGDRRSTCSKSTRTPSPHREATLGATVDMQKRPYRTGSSAPTDPSRCIQPPSPSGPTIHMSCTERKH